MWWSPDGKYLAFATFNDTAVPKFTYQKFKPPGSEENVVRYAYPRVGEPLPTVKLNYWKSSDPNVKPRAFRMPTDLSFNLRYLLSFENFLVVLVMFVYLFSSGHYLYSVSWIPNLSIGGTKESALVATWTDRSQRVANILICLVSDGACQKVILIWPDWRVAIMYAFFFRVTIYPLVNKLRGLNQ